MISDHLKYTRLFKTYDPSINCKDVGDKVCNHTLYYEPEEELFANAKEDRYTEETWKEEISGNLEHFKKLIKEI
ncbi:MAG: hypothetical protein MUO21_08605 [Nitrososphaeraceae archaeon]|nr:hypothetical protein [Nitrososphaeraceae archaeon]